MDCSRVGRTIALSKTASSAHPDSACVCVLVCLSHHIFANLRSLLYPTRPVVDAHSIAEKYRRLIVSLAR